MLHIANNIRLLFHLRKFDFYNRYTGIFLLYFTSELKYSLSLKFSETLHQELIRRFLIELCKFFKYKDNDILKNLSGNDETQGPRMLTLKHPIISANKCKTVTDMDKLENLVDTNNGFLMKAFKDFFFVNKENVECKPKIMTLFERQGSNTY